MNPMIFQSGGMGDRIAEELAFQIRKGFPKIGKTRIPDSETPFPFYSMFPNKI
jgi:hypothetical protein